MATRHAPRWLDNVPVQRAGTGVNLGLVQHAVRVFFFQLRQSIGVDQEFDANVDLRLRENAMPAATMRPFALGGLRGLFGLDRDRLSQNAPGYATCL
jgi:hypothetical protein